MLWRKYSLITQIKLQITQIRRAASGFTLVEILIVILIFSFLAGGMLSVLSTGQNTWYNTETSIELQQNLRSVMMHLTRELHQSGFKCNNPPDCTNTTVQVTILAGAGENGTDILRFKIPVDYNQDGYIKDNNGIVELWGANFTWGCSDFICQKPLSPEGPNASYQIEYLVDANKLLLRRVLDDGLNPINSDILASNIETFQVSRENYIVTITLSAQKRSLFGRVLTSNLTVQAFLRNRG